MKLRPQAWTCLPRPSHIYSDSNFLRELTWISPFVLDCVTAVDVVFVIDSSGSIGEENFEKVKEVIRKLIRHFSVSASNARIGIVQYATSARVVFTLRRSQKSGFYTLEKRVKNLFYTRGATKTGKGLELAYRMLRRSKRWLDGRMLKHEQVTFIYGCFERQPCCMAETMKMFVIRPLFQ